MRKIFIVAALTAVAVPSAGLAQGDAERGIGIELEIAPSMALTKPYGDANYTDETAASLSISGKQPLTRDIEVEASVGPTYTFDDEEEEGGSSSVGGSIELRTRRLAPFQLFASYGAEAKFNGFFRGGDGSKGTLMGGAQYGKEGLPFESGLVIKGAVQRIMSSEAGKDYKGALIETEFKNEFLWFAHASAKAGLQRNIYDGRYGDTDEKRRDWEMLLFGGFDFTPLLKVLKVPFAERIKEATLGYQWSKVSSTIDEEDETKHAFSPAFKLKALLTGTRG